MNPPPAREDLLRVRCAVAGLASLNGSYASDHDQEPSSWCEARNWVGHQGADHAEYPSGCEARNASKLSGSSIDVRFVVDAQNRAIRQILTLGCSAVRDVDAVREPRLGYQRGDMRQRPTALACLIKTARPLRFRRRGGLQR